MKFIWDNKSSASQSGGKRAFTLFQHFHMASHKREWICVYLVLLPVAKWLSVQSGWTLKAPELSDLYTGLVFQNVSCFCTAKAWFFASMGVCLWYFDLAPSVAFKNDCSRPRCQVDGLSGSKATHRNVTTFASGTTRPQRTITSNVRSTLNLTPTVIIVIKFKTGELLHLLWIYMYLESIFRALFYVGLEIELYLENQLWSASIIKNCSEGNWVSINQKPTLRW